ncbi:TPA: GNAT family N-acetyltransferase [Bacillus luti]|nr:GNAT family N-acetyltransferase [Bacillus luti]
MGEIQIKKIEDLLECESNHLVKESKKEGFHFLTKLRNEYENNINTFRKIGECLYGIFQDEELIGIGGVNVDPYTEDTKVGRLRRFYISKDYRRRGLGNMLLNRLLSHAEKYFDVIVLYTDTKQGNVFYTANGFVKGNLYKSSSHYKIL